MELKTLENFSKQHRHLALLLIQATLLLLLLARPLHSVATEFQPYQQTSVHPQHQVQLSSIDNLPSGKQHSTPVKTLDISTLADGANYSDMSETR